MEKFFLPLKMINKLYVTQWFLKRAEGRLQPAEEIIGKSMVNLCIVGPKVLFDFSKIKVLQPPQK